MCVELLLTPMAWRAPCIAAAHHHVGTMLTRSIIRAEHWLQGHAVSSSPISRKKNQPAPDDAEQRRRDERCLVVVFAARAALCCVCAIVVSHQSYASIVTMYVQLHSDVV
jgi:hypothetical protein